MKKIIINFYYKYEFQIRWVFLIPVFLLTYIFIKFITASIWGHYLNDPIEAVRTNTFNNSYLLLVIYILMKEIFATALSLSVAGQVAPNQKKKVVYLLAGVLAVIYSIGIIFYTYQYLTLKEGNILYLFFAFFESICSLLVSLYVIKENHNNNFL